MFQQGGEPTLAWHLLELPSRESNEQDPSPCTGRITGGAPSLLRAVGTWDGHPGNQPQSRTRLGWTQQPGDSEEKVGARVKLLIPN